MLEVPSQSHEHCEVFRESGGRTFTNLWGTRHPQPRVARTYPSNGDSEVVAPSRPDALISVSLERFLWQRRCDIVLVLPW